MFAINHSDKSALGAALQAATKLLVSTTIAIQTRMVLRLLYIVIAAIAVETIHTAESFHWSDKTIIIDTPVNKPADYVSSYLY